MKKYLLFLAILFSLSSFAQAPPTNVKVYKEANYHYLVMFSEYAPGDVTFTITTEDGEIIVQDWSTLGANGTGSFSHFPYRTTGKRVTYYVTATHNGIESEPVEAIWVK